MGKNHVWLYWLNFLESVGNLVAGVFYLLTLALEYELDNLFLTTITGIFTGVNLILFVASWWYIRPESSSKGMFAVSVNVYFVHSFVFMVANGVGLTLASIWYVKNGSGYPSYAVDPVAYISYHHIILFMMVVVIVDVLSMGYITRITEIGTKMNSAMAKRFGKQQNNMAGEAGVGVGGMFAGGMFNNSKK
jgi:hypothetical protein